MNTPTEELLQVLRILLEDSKEDELLRDRNGAQVFAQFAGTVDKPRPGVTKFTAVIVIPNLTVPSKGLNFFIKAATELGIGLRKSSKSNRPSTIS